MVLNSKYVMHGTRINTWADGYATQRHASLRMQIGTHMQMHQYANERAERIGTIDPVPLHTSMKCNTASEARL